MNLSCVKQYIFLLILSVISLGLKANDIVINSPYSTNAIIDTTICDGDCIVFFNTSYCEAGTFRLADNQLLRLSLTERVRQTEFTICEGETFPGRDWATSGMYNYQTAVGACPITVWVDLKVEKHKAVYINQQIRYNECYKFGPNTLCQTGEYELRYSTAFGCDSIVYVNLVVEELLIDTLQAVSVCNGETYTLMDFDTVLTTSGIYQFNDTTDSGRERLTILDFRVDGEIITYLEEKICEGSNYVQNGQVYDKSGRYEIKYLASNGCDSTVIIDLNVISVDTTRMSETIAADQFIIIGANEINLEGMHEFVFQAASGCDSIVQLQLTIEGESRPIEFTNAIQQEICDGNIKRTICRKDLPFIIGGNTFYQGGEFDFTYVSPSGCEAEVTLELIIELNPVLITKRICEGDTYFIENKEYRQTGFYKDTIISGSVNSCDSVVYLDLMVMPVKDTIVSKTICWGDPYVVDGQYITESGEYTQIFQTGFGCDSVVTTILTIDGGSNPNTSRLELCAGDRYADDIGNEVYVSGLYNFRFANEAGCDSIVSIELLIPDTIRFKIDTFFCKGETFEFENFAATRSGLYRERFRSTGGCDSLVEYTLTALDCEINSIQDVDTIICGGNTGEFSFKLTKGLGPFTYQWASESGEWSGGDTNLGLEEEVIEKGLPSGEYGVTVSDRNGKEFFLEVVIFRPEIITADLKSSPLEGTTNLVCSGEKGAFIEILPAGGVPPYRYEWSNGVSNSNRIDALAAGNYAVTVRDELNCPFLANMEITEPLPILLSLESSNASCEDQASGQINILETAGGTPPYKYELEGYADLANKTDFQNLAAGEYLISAIDNNGCQVDTLLFITAPEILSLDFESEIELKLGAAYEMEIFSSGTPKEVSWEEASGLSCDDCLNLIFNPTASESYSVTVTSMDGCQTTADLTVRVLKDRFVFIPTVFSPNFDGTNDRFSIYGNQAVDKIEYFKVYSRMGELLYETTELQINEEENGWDGFQNGKLMLPGVYIWQAKISFVDGESEVYSGDVTLLK